MSRTTKLRTESELSAFLRIANWPLIQPYWMRWVAVQAIPLPT